MSEIKTIIVSVCTAAILSGVTTMIIPNGNIAKAVKTLLALFMIVVLISPLIGKVSLDIDMPPQSANDQIDDIMSTVQQQMMVKAEETITQQVKTVIEQCEIYDAKIKINMDITEDGRISIRQVGILVPQKDIHLKSIIKQLVDSKLGLYADVYALEDEDG